MADTKWEVYESAVTLLDTGLNGLAIAGLAGSTAQDQDTPLQLFADFELFVSGFGSSVNQNVRIAELYIVPTLDGTNFADGHDAAVIPQKSFLVGVFEKVSATGTGAARMIITGIPLPPFDFKAVLRNISGVAFAANSNTLKMRRYALQSV